MYYTAYTLNFKDETIKGSILVYLVLSSISHFGSLCFKKNALVKTSLFVIILSAALSYFNFYSMKAMIPEESMLAGKFFTIALRLGGNTVEKGLITLPAKWETFMYWLLPGMLYVLFWISSYYKLKEKQV